MLRYLFIFLFTQSVVFGCALCAIYSPETRVTLKVNSTDTKITSIDVKWVLTKDFTNQLIQVYDLNLDNKIDKNELKLIQKALVDYAISKNFMMHISYGEIINKEKSDNINVVKYTTKIINGILHFFYTVKLNYDIKDDYALYVNVNDDENYFVLLLQKGYLDFPNKAKITKIVNKQSVIFLINSKNTPIIKNSIKKEKNITKEIHKKEKVQKIKKPTLIEKFVKKVKQYLLLVQKGNNFALFTLLFVSFLYGMFHALAPGHGKALVFSYFSSNESSYKKAFLVSLACAFVHIIGALILVSISVFILQSILNSFVSDSVKILTEISAVMIMLIALFMLFQKLKHKKSFCAVCSTSSSNNKFSWSNKNTISLKKNDTINFKKLNKKRNDLLIVLTAGLIPCPGTVILFIYAFILKTYFAVFLASIAISFGMGVVIFLSSFLGVSLHKASSKSIKLRNILEITSPIIMFILGLILLLNSNQV